MWPCAELTNRPMCDPAITLWQLGVGCSCPPQHWFQEEVGLEKGWIESADYMDQQKGQKQKHLSIQFGDLISLKRLEPFERNLFQK